MKEICFILNKEFVVFQVYMYVCYVILCVFLEVGKGLVQLIILVEGLDGKLDVLIMLDREKIEFVGRLVIGNFFRKLQVCVMNVLFNWLWEERDFGVFFE